MVLVLKEFAKGEGMRKNNIRDSKVSQDKEASTLKTFQHQNIILDVEKKIDTPNLKLENAEHSEILVNDK